MAVEISMYTNRYAIIVVSAKKYTFHISALYVKLLF